MYSALGFFRKHKTFLFSIGFLVLFSITVSYANPPTSPYAPGSTLDPQCAPGDANCYVSGSGGAGIAVQTNGTANGSQSKLNLVAGSNITLADDGNGNITITSTGGTDYSGSGTPSFQAIGGTASGDYSAAFGNNTTASGDYSTAFGANTTASVSGSTAFGINTIANGSQSTAFGAGTEADGFNATAFGYYTYANGGNSTAFGDTTTADSLDSTAIGALNIGGGNPTTWVPTDPLFEIGNGGDGEGDGNPNANSTSDAFEVLKNGDTTVGGTLTSEDDLTVNGRSTSSSSALAAPTNATATADENDSDGDYTGNQSSITYHIYAYKTVDGTRKYSSTYATVTGPNYTTDGNEYSIDLAWDAVPGATGYRVLISNPKGFGDSGFDYGADTTTTSMIDDDFDGDPAAGDFETYNLAVTPVDTGSGSSTVFGNNIFGGLNIDKGINISGTSTTSGGSSGLAAPTNPVATADETGDGDYTDDSSNYTYKIYAYTLVNGTREYSPTYATVQGPDDESGNSYSIDLSWDPVSGATGYRVIANYGNPNFLDGADTTTNSIVDDDDDSSQGADFESGSQTIVTPVDSGSSSVTTYTNANIINGSITISGNSIFDGSGNLGIGTLTPSAPLEVTGLAKVGSLNVTGTGGSGGIPTPTGGAIRFNYASFSSGYIADGDTWTFKIYALTGTCNNFGSLRNSCIPGDATYSAPETVTATDNNSGDIYNVNLSWTGVPGAIAYRIIESDTDGYVPAGNGFTTTSTSLIDGGYTGAIFLGGSYTVVTPTSQATYTNVNTINGATNINGNSVVTGNLNITGTLTCGGVACSGVSLQTNSVANGSQSLLNLVAGTGITLSDDGSGDITISASGGSGSYTGAGTPSFQANGGTASANYSFASGLNSTATYEGDVALGIYDTASGGDSLALGYENTASGPISTAFGNSNTASGTDSTAYGLDSHATGLISTAFGYDNIASGSQSTAFGDTNVASASDSTAFGLHSDASAVFGFAEGNTSVASSFEETVIGGYNVGGGTSNYNWQSTDPLFEIGNGGDSHGDFGEPEHLSDALVVLKNGNVGIGMAVGTDNPGYLLTVGSSSTTTGTAVAQFQNAGGTCTITPSVTGGISCTSDMNLKKNITNLSDNSTWSFNNNITPDNQTILADIMALKPVDYNWNVEADGTQKHAGFIAQEVQQVFPDLVHTDPNTNLLSLDYTGLVPYTVEALQEMNFNITNIDDLTKTNSWRDALEAWFADSANGIQSFFSGTITTNNLCVGTTCVTQQQFLQMVQNSSGNNSTTTVISGGSSSDSTSDTSASSSTSSDSQTPDAAAPVITTPTPTADGTSDTSDDSTQSPDVAPADPSTPGSD